MEVKQSASGREQFGAWREGEHDDLVFAVALAYWAAKRVCPRGLDGEDGWWQRAPGTLIGNWQGTNPLGRK